MQRISLKMMNSKRNQLFGISEQFKKKEKDILKDAGTITTKIAKDFAESEFEKYTITQDRFFRSDFDEIIRKTNI